MHNKTVNQIFDGHISPKKWIFWFFQCLRLRDFLNIGVGEKVFIWKGVKWHDNQFSIYQPPLWNASFSVKTWFFLKLWKIGCTKLQKNPKKWNNTLGFFFGFHSKLVREHNGPKKMDPPCMFLVGYFGTFNLNFDFLKKKIFGTP